MPKSPKEKTDYAITLLAQGKTYREIQQALVERFGSGMSNTTLLKLQYPRPKIDDLLKRIDELERELLLFKHLYFELESVTKNKFGVKIPDSSKNKLNFCPYCGWPAQPAEGKCRHCGEGLNP